MTTLSGEHSDQSLGPRRFLSLIRENLRLSIGVTTASFIFAIVLALVLPVKYRAEAMTAPRSEESTDQSLSSLQRNIASVTGLGSASNFDSYELVETIRSERLTRDLITSENLLPILYPEKWDEQAREWRPDNSIMGSITRLFSRSGSELEGIDGAPSLSLAVEDFDQLRSVELSQSTGLISVSIEWSDPGIAAEWVNKTIQHTNDYLLRRDEREALSRLSYYTSQLEQESTINIRSNIFQLIQNEYQTLATLKASEEYAIRTIDPAFVPHTKVRPQRTVIVIMGVVLGILASIGFLVLRDEYGRSSGEDS